MLDELVVYLLVGLLLFGLGHPHSPFTPYLETNVTFTDSSHCFRLYGLVKSFDFSKGMGFFLVGIEDLIRHGVISLAIRANNVFSRADKAYKIGPLKTGRLALLTSLAELNDLLFLP